MGIYGPITYDKEYKLYRTDSSLIERTLSTIAADSVHTTLRYRLVNFGYNIHIKRRNFTRNFMWTSLHTSADEQDFFSLVVPHVAEKRLDLNIPDVT